MKKIIVTLFALIVTLSVYGQGQTLRIGTLAADTVKARVTALYVKSTQIYLSEAMATVADTTAYKPMVREATSGLLRQVSWATISTSVTPLDTTSLSNRIDQRWSILGNAGTSWATNFIGTTDNNGFRIRTNNTERMVIDSNGYAAIGRITSANYRLSLGGDATVRMKLQNTTGTAPYEISQDNTNVIHANYGSGSFAIQTNNNTQGLIVYSTGHIGIGTTATISDSYDINLKGLATTERSIGVVRNTTAATAGNNLTINAGGAVSGGTNLTGGNLILSSGTATGNRYSDVMIYTPTTTDGSGTTDRAPVVREWVLTRFLADNSSFGLHDARSGMAWITFGDGEEYAWFSFTTDAVVTLITNSANVTTTQGTNDKLNIYDNGTTVQIENTFTATKTMTVKVLYNL